MGMVHFLEAAWIASEPTPFYNSSPACPTPSASAPAAVLSWEQTFKCYDSDRRVSTDIAEFFNTIDPL